MKGKKIFTKAEADAIRILIKMKLQAPPDKQKGIRQKIRNIGFYYSDFSANKDGYTVSDFDNLIKSGAIKII